MLDNASRGDVLVLPDEKFRVKSLFINKPLTLLGKPGTVIEIDGGNIRVDFTR